MVGVFSFLAVASIIALAVAAVRLVLSATKKKPKKPAAIMAAVSVVLFLVSFVGIGLTYHPTPEQVAERERIAAEKAAEKEERERQKAEEAARKEAKKEQERQKAEETSQKETEEATQQESATQSAPPEPQTQMPVQSPSESAPVSAPPKSVPSSPPASASVTPPAPVEFETPKETAPTESEPDFIEEHRSDIVVASKMTLDNFISNYKIPLATQLWTIAKFDGDGAIAAMADVEEKATNVTVTAIVIFTPVMEDERMTGATPHFVSVGDVVYGDDGYCDDVFSALAGIGNNR